MKAKEPSLLFVTSVIVALVTLFLSTGSVLVAALIPLYLAPLAIPARLPRDSGLIWGVRLFLYAGCALLGRAPLQQYYYFGAQAFVTMGLILGGELIIQSFREPPKGFKFDPLMLFVSSILFMVGAGLPMLGTPLHIWICAPLWMFLTLLATSDVRESKTKFNTLARIKQFGLILIAVTGGFLAHSALGNNRAALTALSSKLLSTANPHISEVGAADAPQLGSSFNSNASTARMLRIEGSMGDSHLRAGAFDQYKNGTWGPALSTRPVVAALPKDTREQKGALMTPEARRLSPKFATDQRTDWNAKITVLRDTDKVMFAPLNSAALLPIPALGSNSFDWSRFAGPLECSDPTPLSYGIVDSRTDIRGVQTEQGPLCVSLDPRSLDKSATDYDKQFEFLAKERDQLLEVPDEIEPEVRQLAFRITKGARTDQAKIDAVSDYLLRNYKYSLDFVKTDRDPVSDFLLNKRPAHCQYFASSATMLLRCIGVRSRYVTGYWAHEVADDGSTVVRGRDAHAWCESFVAGVGWVTVETTPPDGRADPRANPLTGFQKMQERLEDTWAKIRNWFGNLSSLQIAGIMLGVLALWGLERWRQNLKKARALPTKPVPPLELQPLARGFERALQKRGITLLDGQTWSEAVPNEWDEGREFVQGYNLARFSPRDEEQLRALTVKLRAIQK